VRGRYRAEPARFPVQVDFYQALDRFWSARYRTPRDVDAGPEIVIYAPDSTQLPGLDAWWSERAAHHGRPARLPPDDQLASTFAQRALCLTRAGRFAQALRLWPTALRWKPAPAEWWYAQGLALAGTGERHEAYVALREANRRDPKLADAGLLAAELALLDGAFDDSRRALEEVTAREALSASDRARADSLERALARRPRGGR